MTWDRTGQDNGTILVKVPCDIKNIFLNFSFGSGVEKSTQGTKEVKNEKFSNLSGTIGHHFLVTEF